LILQQYVFLTTAFSRQETKQQPHQKELEMITKFLRDETGLELSEYAVAAALIALAVVLVFGTLGKNIAGVITNLANNIK
jgi:pilus assembly protein Flp/PilA